LGFEFTKETYSGGIKEITLGQGDFEGEMPHKPRIAMEIWDMEPEEWAQAALSPFKDVISDPAAWAKKCVDEYGADMIVLQLKSTDPNGNDASADDAVATVKKVLGAIDVPLIIWGTASVEKDEEVLKKIAEECQGKSLILGPVEDKNHKGIGAAAMGFGHTLIASSPIDVNLAKQCNILLENLGVSMDKLIIDPTTGGLGYGLEYSYSVMERKCKEAKQLVDEAPTLGDPEKRGILMEAVGAVAYLMGGSDVLIMRHPESMRLVKSYIDLVYDGGAAADVTGIQKQLDAVDVDLLALSPEPDLTIEEEKKAAPAKKAAAPKPEKKAAPAAQKGAAPEPEKKAAAPAEPAPSEAPKAEAAAGADAAAKAEAEAKAEAKAEADAEAQAKAAEETKAKAAAQAQAKAEAGARAKAEADAQKAKIEAELDEIRQKRTQERAELAAKRAAAEKKAAKKTPAAVQKSMVEKMIDNLDWIHKR
jgi:acetyl-CoA decarbonylase/synthase complex subunit delta